MLNADADAESRSVIVGLRYAGSATEDDGRRTCGLGGGGGRAADGGEGATGCGGSCFACPSVVGQEGRGGIPSFMSQRRNITIP